MLKVDVENTFKAGLKHYSIADRSELMAKHSVERQLLKEEHWETMDAMVDDVDRELEEVWLREISQ